ncbi:MAG TPA: lactate utilization protein [Candidatus Copromorpha excrementigallinarum]|uniref:Lactate utilization protein n=1 Tax=Candidatus Allocopromorpha excrementigallinarum TaxID=2840742 RepID=A0A9D1HZV6_9FIRM|nr:lactate utilization protein [Candidatus Copromorpha excrementigallinarum]
MDKSVKAANKIKIEKVIKGLEKRNMTGYYCDSRGEALELIMSMIPRGAAVGCGYSVTMDEIGVREALRKGDYDFTDPFVFSEREESLAARKKALRSDVFLSGLNAVTMDGEIVNIDGTGNRVAGIIFGPDKVILAAGANKIVPYEKDAVDRIRSDACPANCIRLGKKTPCAFSGKCADCLIKGNTVCGHIVTTRFSATDGRIHVVLINEALGY